MCIHTCQLVTLKTSASLQQRQSLSDCAQWSGRVQSLEMEQSSIFNQNTQELHKLLPTDVFDGPRTLRGQTCPSADNVPCCRSHQGPLVNLALLPSWWVPCALATSLGQATVCRISFRTLVLHQWSHPKFSSSLIDALWDSIFQINPSPAFLSVWTTIAAKIRPWKVTLAPFERQKISKLWVPEVMIVAKSQAWSWDCWRRLWPPLLHSSPTPKPSKSHLTAQSLVSTPVYCLRSVALSHTSSTCLKGLMSGRMAKHVSSKRLTWHSPWHSPTRYSNQIRPAPVPDQSHWVACHAPPHTSLWPQTYRLPFCSIWVYQTRLSFLVGRIPKDCSLPPYQVLPHPVATRELSPIQRASRDTLSLQRWARHQPVEHFRRRNDEKAQKAKCHSIEHMESASKSQKECC